ncbi:MAG: MBL fold metallo-hydrolase [Chthoniobacteraceae bacterium]|nr:MBL fold metallo-hydrolase [Chthoniobacteraceae bacterium]
MFQITLLGSGSAGNCALLESGGCRLLIDGGLSAKQITLRLASVGIDPATLNGILITHEHTDHVGGLRVLCKKTPIPVYCTRLTAEVLRKDHLALHPDVRQFHAGAEFTIGDIGIQSFPVPHDAVDPIGFTFRHGNASLGFLTDLGKCTALARQRVRGVSTLVIETNHDEKTLQNDPHRPWALKQRIMSIHGHLSNAAAAAELAGLLEHGLQRAILCHLSRDCNSPELALNEVRARLAAAGGADAVEVYCAAQKEVSPQFPIGMP